MTSAGRVTYTAGEDTQTISLPEVTIPRANPGLELGDILTADQTAITNGETVTLTLTIKNNGNITYSNITVTDAKYGELFTNLTLGAGETLVKEKQFTLSESTAFKYTITLPDNTGTTSTVTSNEVKVSVYDPSQVLMLSLVADTDTPTIASSPADVAFTLTLTNNSSFEAKSVQLKHGSTDIYTVDSLKPGETVSVTRMFTVSQAGKFRFTASAKDPLDNTVSFDSNEIVLTYAAPVITATMAPVVTPAPLVTVTAAPIDVLEPATVQTNRLLRYAAMALVALFAVTFVLFVISTVMRAKHRSASRSAYDHMELADKRDYKEPARYGSSAPEQEASAPAEDLLTEKPSDAILNEERPPVVNANSENGGYRLTREDSSPAFEPAAEEKPAEEKPIEEKPVEEKPAEEKPQEGARHRRAGRKSEAPSEDE